MGNAATVQAIYEAFGRGDVPAILERLADDVRWDEWPAPTSAQDAGVPWLASRRGPDGVGAFFESLAGLEIHTFAPTAIVAGDEHVVALIDLDATVRASGMRVRDSEVHVWQFGADGRVDAFRHYVDTGKHVAAVTAATPAVSAR